MRRRDREIVEWKEKLAVLERCRVMRLGLQGEEYPYVIPLNFGYVEENDTLRLYFHCALQGKKLELLQKNNKVCVEMDGDHELLEGENACSYGFVYESLIGFGEVFILEEKEKKIAGLNCLMNHQTGRNEHFAFSDAMLKQTLVAEIRIASLTGKRRARPEEQQ